MQLNFASYTAFAAVTPSDTTLLNCRAIYVGGAGSVIVNTAQSDGTSVTFAAVPVGTILPIALDSGRVMAASGATNLVALQ